MPFWGDGVFGSRAAEFKFNPWHDPRDGRFTFAGTGRYYGDGGGRPAGGRRQSAPDIVYVDGKDEPPVPNWAEAEAWTAQLPAEHGNEPRFRKAIEARRREYWTKLPRASDALRKVVEFADGVADAEYDIAQDVATGLYTLVTTNPVTTVRNIGASLAGTIDAAIAAEDIPAHVQFRRAANWVSHASAHDLGYAAGKIAGNTALVIAPEALTAKLSAVRRLGKVRTPNPKEPPRITWVDEYSGGKGAAKNYNDSAMGARSNIQTKRARVPALKRKMPDGTTRLVRFDGMENGVLIDRKWAIARSPKAMDQALRQSEALSQHGLVGVWQVPTLSAKKEAFRLLEKLNISNIIVRVVEP